MFSSELYLNISNMFLNYLWQKVSLLRSSHAIRSHLRRSHPVSSHLNSYYFQHFQHFCFLHYKTLNYFGYAHTFVLVYWLTIKSLNIVFIRFVLFFDNIFSLFQNYLWVTVFTYLKNRIYEYYQQANMIRTFFRHSITMKMCIFLLL